MKESDFGFKKYNKEEHTSKVKEVFYKVANKIWPHEWRNVSWYAKVMEKKIYRFFKSK